MIKKLKLNDFLCFHDKEFEFNKINIIIGKNYSGKTTIADAIIYALTNNCPRIQYSNNDIITLGKNRSKVILDVIKDDNLYSIIRERIRKGNSGITQVKLLKNGKEVKVSNNKELIEWLSAIFKIRLEMLDYNRIIQYSYFRSNLVMTNDLAFFDHFNKIFKTLDTIYNNLSNYVEQLRDSYTNLREKISEIRAKLDLYEKISSSNEKIEGLISKREDLERELESKNKEKDEYLKYKAIINAKINDLKKLINSSICPLCGSKISQHKRREFAEDLHKYNKEKQNLTLLINEFEEEFQRLKKEFFEINEKIQRLNISLESINYKELQNQIQDLNKEMEKTQNILSIVSLLKKEFPSFKNYLYASFLNKYKEILISLSQQVFGERTFFKISQGKRLRLLYCTDNLEKDYNLLSTSEKIKVNLLLQLLIIHLFKSMFNIPFMIFDELFDHLDSINFEKVLQYFVFGNIKKQLFIITHRVEDIRTISYINQDSVSIIDLNEK